MASILATIKYYAGRAKGKVAARIKAFIAVRKSGRKSIPAQAREIIRLRLGTTRVKAHEYFSQAIYDDGIYPNKALPEFGGYWFKEVIHAKLNDIRWEGMVTDKLILYGLFSQFGLPHPKVRAVACNYERSYGDTPIFHDLEKLATFLRESMTYPFFCKPVKGSYARGAARVGSYDRDTDSLTLANGSSVAVVDFLCSLEDGDGWGFLFQDAVLAHPETKKICGDRVCGCRIVMLLDDSGAYPYRIVWKIPTGNNFTDNFDAGKFGNMAAAVDVKTGIATRIVSGNGIDMRLNQPHPNTGYELVGTQIPQWDELMATMKRAAECFPGFRWQHWDVGITSDGPVLFELNSAGNTDLVQISSGKGIYDDQLKAFVQRYANWQRPIGKLFSPTA
jgi:hypothetical protein